MPLFRFPKINKRLRWHGPWVVGPAKQRRPGRLVDPGSGATVCNDSGGTVQQLKAQPLPRCQRFGKIAWTLFAKR